MKFISYLVLVIFTAFCLACHNSTDALGSYGNVRKHATGKNIIISQLHIDTIKVDHLLSRSGDGFWKMSKDSFYYFDRVMGVVDSYLLNGHFISRRLGFGQDPGELLDEFASACHFNNGWLVVENRYAYLFDKGFWNKKMKTLVNWEEDFENQKDRILKNPDPTKDVEVYIPESILPQVEWIKDAQFLMKVQCCYPSLFSLQFYKESAIAAIYDFDKGTFVSLLGHYPPKYLEGFCYPAFSNPYYVPYKDGKYLVIFPLDPEIYICNERFEPVESFGIAGDLKNTMYLKLADQQEISHKEFIKEQSVRGFYVSLFYHPKDDVTLRMYKTGLVDESSGGDNPSRMQIYKGFDLIGDVAIPNDFEVFGMKDDCFFADGYLNVLEEGDVIGFYIFKLF